MSLINHYKLTEAEDVSQYWYGEVLTQLPYELKLTMPRTDRGKRGYSNSYIAKLK